MNVRKAIALSASLLMALALPVSQAYAQEGAKGLFFQQMKNPGQNLNTGVQYWIELHRKGKMTKVTNKASFKHGDRIRFHVTPNIDGFAYIILRSGSQGEQAVLFPDPNRNDDNRVQRGKDYALPEDGFLTFDANPGLEKVSLLLSRTPLNAQAYLAKPSKQHTLIASARAGSKDLIPSKIVLAYSQEPKTAKPQPKPATTTVKKTTSSKTRIASSKTRRTVKTKVKSRRQTTIAKKPAQKKPVHLEKAGVVTVVYNEPNAILTVDVDLDHI